MLLNPFATVSGRKHQAVDGRTPEMTIAEARTLLASIDATTLVGLRDRALFGTLCYTGARIGAVVRLRRGDLQEHALRIFEKPTAMPRGDSPLSLVRAMIAPNHVAA